jgi:putative ABC transport system substrate-binding protein
MKRREFIPLIVAAAAYPVGLRAQQPGPQRRIGLLMNSNESDPEWKAYLAAFMQGLRSLGWVEGQNLRSDVRWSIGDPDR